MRISDWSSDVCSSDLEFRHSYPHSWRSKAKVIFRCTPQWFIAMDRPVDQSAQGQRSLRSTALTAIDDTRWVPERSKNRILSMVEGRPDWVIRSEEHTSELQSLMRISYAVFCLKKKKDKTKT